MYLKICKISLSDLNTHTLVLLTDRTCADSPATPRPDPSPHPGSRHDTRRGEGWAHTPGGLALTPQHPSQSPEGVTAAIFIFTVEVSAI